MHSALLRSRVYGLLRRIFTGEVDGALLSWCRSQQEDGLWSELGMDLEQVVGTTDPEAAVERLAVDFCQLFLTSGAEGSPHESVQIAAGGAEGATSLLQGGPASAVKKLYREAGMELAEEGHLLSDSLGVELEFMERLSGQEAAAAAEALLADVPRLRDLQRRMLDEHLARWVPDYGRKLSGQARTSFYRAMLELVADFVEWDLREHSPAD